MMDNKIPKVFISYSWLCQERVIQFAERLISHGVEVVIDVWNLKEGQDKFAFMEQAVTNPDINKVIMVCDKSYTEKADSRTGGVGDEAMIISPEIYGQAKQQKFIPVIYELDDNLEAYCPAFVKSRIYIDLSPNNEKYEVEYEKLLRNIFEKPMYRKPLLGKMPEWLENENVNLSPVRDIIKQIRGYIGNDKTRTDYLIRQALSVFSTALHEYRIDMDKPIDDKEFLLKIEEHQILRDIFFHFVETIIYCGLPLENIIPSFFETMYNETCEYGNRSSFRNCDFENIDYFLWESFIGTTAILLHYEKFSQLNAILQYTYFLRDGYHDSAELKPYNYTKFNKPMEYIERVCKPNCDNPKWFSLASEILIHREKKPLITKKSLTEADVILFQLYHFLDINKDNYSYWFPYTYAYYKCRQTLWTRLKSKKYCEKILPLFGVSSLEELKKTIIETNRPQGMRYQSSFDESPWITDSINPNTIGSLN